MRSLAAIALGSNLESEFGDREANLREAVKRVGELGDVRAVSSFYDTEPVGYVDQPRFLNGALLLETALQPLELMRGSARRWPSKSVASRWPLRHFGQGPGR